MAQLYKVHGGDQAFCPFARAYCYTDCAWLIPAFEAKDEIAFYTCCMNNDLLAALMTAEQLKQYKEEMMNREDE
jgi:hypothetical protein